MYVPRKEEEYWGVQDVLMWDGQKSPFYLAPVFWLVVIASEVLVAGDQQQLSRKGSWWLHVISMMRRQKNV
jgi:hypothetical protein